jgi:integrase
MTSFKEFVEYDLNLKADDILIKELGAFFEREFPYSLEVLRRYDKQVSAENGPQKIKDFYLSKQKSKKLGFVYIVRYRDKDGNIIPSHWSAKTNNPHEAERFAVENRERLLNGYYSHNEGDKLFRFLADYYSPNNKDYLNDVDRGDRRPITEAIRKNYYNFINNIFIPFMKEVRHKRTLKDIGRLDIMALQNKLLKDSEKPLKGQTINNNMAGVKAVFKTLLKYEKIQNSPFMADLTLQRISKDTGMYELPIMRGVFLKSWGDNLSYLLNLLVYTCGLRNEETNNLKVNDIKNSFNGITYNNYFLNVCASINGKTKNAKRVVPLHPFVYQKLIEYIKENGRGENDYIFEADLNNEFGTANIVLGKLLGYTEQGLEERNIRYYSGRHFWKTMLNCEGLGRDVEELFMGHRVSADVKKTYNHKDKIGRENLTKKIELMFDIISKTLFTEPAPEMDTISRL